MGAVLDGFIILSQFGIATFLLALAGEGRLGLITNFDQYGLFGLTAFLYYSSGRGIVRVVRYLDTHLWGPTRCPRRQRTQRKEPNRSPTRRRTHPAGCPAPTAYRPTTVYGVIVGFTSTSNSMTRSAVGSAQGFPLGG